MLRTLSIPTPGRGLVNITDQVAAIVEVASEATGTLGPDGSGLCTVFVQHTSASILIQENADPAVRVDLEAWLSRLVRDGDPLFTHDEEGPDDMPAHIRAVLTATSVSIPIVRGTLGLGVWQGLYLWEHRTRDRVRTVLVHIGD